MSARMPSTWSPRPSAQPLPKYQDRVAWSRAGSPSRMVHSTLETPFSSRARRMWAPRKPVAPVSSTVRMARLPPEGDRSGTWRGYACRGEETTRVRAEEAEGAGWF